MLPDRDLFPVIVMAVLFLAVSWRCVGAGYARALSTWFDPSFARRYRWLLLLAVCGAVAGLSLDRLQPLVVGLEGGALGAVREFGNLYGNAVAAFSLITGAFFVAKLYRRERVALWIMGLFAATLAAGLSSDLWKVVFARSRPFVAEQGWFQYGAILGSGLDWRFFSFPSGHTVTTWTMAFFAAQTGWYRTAFVLLVCAECTAFARILAGVHWPADVVAGALWAAVAALPFAHWFRRMEAQHGAKHGRYDI
ncbi:MAG: phosphatase PAP2 family protein [Synergistales bacterium]|nr:phosphatase PAP2 family protein [Synergistales bacterium]